MGNTINSDKKKIDSENIKSVYNDTFWSTTDTEIANIKTDYKVIKVDWFNEELINYEMFADEYFNINTKINPQKKQKKQVVIDMVKYYQNHKDSEILTKQTDSLCNRKERVCICNVNADNFRKIYNRVNYKADDKFISWIKKSNEPF